MSIPKDSPEWLEKAVEDIEGKASNLLRTSPDASRAAGYYACLADLKEQFEVEARLQDEARRKNFRLMVHGE